jgi:hypothetical protein
MQVKDTAPDALIECITRNLVSWKLVGPAVAFLHMNKPFSFVGSQALLMLQPVLDILVAREIVEDWVALFADREQVEHLIARLEVTQETSAPVPASQSQ